MKKVVLFAMFAVIAMSSATSCVVTSCGNLSDERRLPLTSHVLKLQSDFTKVENNTVIDIEYTQSSEFSAELVCPEELMDFVIFSVEDNLLVIKLSDKLNDSERNDVNRDLRYSRLFLSGPQLTDIRVNGSSTFMTTNDLYAKNLTAVIHGSGDVIFEGVNTVDGTVSTQVVGSGDIVFRKEVKAKSAFMQVSGSGDIDCGSLAVKSVTAQVNGSGDIKVPEMMTETAEFLLNGSGDLVALKIKANSVNAILVGSGDMKLEGECETAVLSLSSSGDLIARNLIAQDVTASVIGSGDLSCHAIKKLTAKVSGSGDIRYKGNPHINQNPTISTMIDI